MTVGDDAGPLEPFDRALRACALGEDAGDAASFDLGELWRELCRGGCKIADSFHSEARCYLVLVPEVASSLAHERCLRHFDVLERLLLDGSQKQVALSLGLSTSTIAGITKDCLRALGFSCPPSKVPPLLVMAAHASRGQAFFPDARSRQLQDGAAWFRVVSVSRPDHRLEGHLSAGELAVARLLVDGKSHEEIARLRRASRRTVANQLAAVFQRLGVSGRAELLRDLSTRCADPRPANGNARPAP
jgi:DNA-binding NarL/FixJ family response regulator